MRRLRAPFVWLVCWLLPHAAVAGGTLSFLPNPPNAPITVQSGAAASWMNGFSDWPASHPVSGGGFAVPGPAGSVTLETSRTTGPTANLILRFTIPDSTHRKPDGTSLTLGDKIIVQIDPNASRDATLEVGADFRYEITIIDEAIASQKRRTRDSAATNEWGVKANLTATTGTTSFAFTGSSYTVTLNIPLASLGPPAGNIGLAILVVNDLGNTHVVGADTKTDVTAVSFPFGDMPASSGPSTDPGLIDPISAGGPWIQPDHWGTGLFSPAVAGPAQLQFTHLAQPWLSKSIKLSVCNIGRWVDIDAVDVQPSQNLLVNWYKYERDLPCQMGLWIRATNTGTAAATARLLVLWADAGLATSKWRFVELTGPISFGPGDSTHRVVWDRVPAKGSVPGGTTHPCLRVYLVDTIDKTDPTSGVVQTPAVISAINDDTKLAAFERAYSVPSPWNLQVAQMNFTNLFNGTCSTPACAQPLVAQRSGIGDRILALLSLEPVFAQPVPEPPAGGREILATPVQGEGGPKEGRPERGAWFRVIVDGFAVPQTPPAAPYVFVEPIGGVGWAVPYSMVAAAGLNLGFNVTNPAILYRDLVATPVNEIAAPVRRILLATRVEAPTGMDVPKITLTPLSKEFLAPGETIVASVVAPKMGRGGYSWWWLLLLAAVILVVVVVRWLR